VSIAWSAVLVQLHSSVPARADQSRFEPERHASATACVRRSRSSHEKITLDTLEGGVEPAAELVKLLVMAPHPHVDRKTRVDSAPATTKMPARTKRSTRAEPVANQGRCKERTA
jgi:hypothetical protein